MTVTTETSLKHVDIQFSDLTYQIKTKCLLNGVSGDFLGGQLTGILGSSGAGKTTLLNILAGQIHYGVSGSIYINGKPRNNKLFHRISSYIMQEDILQPRLSVKEIMMSAVHLKLPGHHSQREKNELIQQVLISMRLDDCVETRTEHLSGGQKKRLCIALELVNNPPVIFLDEPTTGLDDVSTKQCIALLKSLATKGKTIICTIHQPSNTIFELFDQVYFMAEGNCLYSGSTSDLVPFLSDVGTPCPETYSPADYVIELSQYEKDATLLKNQNQRKQIKIHSKSYRGYINPYYIDQTTSYVFAVSFWKQFWTLFKRKLLQISRGKVTMGCEIGHHLLCGVIVGAVFYDRGNNPKYLVDNIKMFYGIIIYFMFSHGMIIALTYPDEVRLLQREYFNRWYSLKAYFLAANLSMLPVSCSGAVIFSILVYWLTGQPMESSRLTMFVVISVLFVFATQGFGLTIGAIFNPTNGACLGSVIGICLILLASYNMGGGEITNPIMKGLMALSYAYHGYVGFGTSAFRNRAALPDCPDIYCLFSDPEILLQQVGMEKSTVQAAILYLVLFAAFHRVLAYGFLKCKLQPDSRLYQLLK